MKIVKNTCYGGFGLSSKASQEYLKLIGKECFFYKDNLDYKNRELSKIPLEEADDSILLTISTKDYGDVFNGNIEDEHYFLCYNLDRTDENLIKAIETIGEKESSGRFAELKIVEIPDGIEWEIDEYDGIESIHESHRSW